VIDQLITSFEGNDTVTRAVIVLAITLLASLVSRFIVNGLVRRASATQTPWDDAFARALGSPLRLLVWVVGLSLACEIAEDTPLAEVIDSAREIGVIVSIAWFLIRFINSAQANLADHKTRSGKKLTSRLPMESASCYASSYLLPPAWWPCRPWDSVLPAP